MGHGTDAMINWFLCTYCINTVVKKQDKYACILIKEYILVIEGSVPPLRCP